MTGFGCGHIEDISGRVLGLCLALVYPAARDGRGDAMADLDHRALDQVVAGYSAGKDHEQIQRELMECAEGRHPGLV